MTVLAKKFISVIDHACFLNHPKDDQRTIANRTNRSESFQHVVLPKVSSLHFEWGISLLGLYIFDFMPIFTVNQSTTKLCFQPWSCQIYSSFYHFSSNVKNQPTVSSCHRCSFHPLSSVVV